MLTDEFMKKFTPLPKNSAIKKELLAKADQNCKPLTNMENFSDLYEYTIGMVSSELGQIATKMIIKAISEQDWATLRRTLASLLQAGFHWGRVYSWYEHNSDPDEMYAKEEKEVVM